MDVDLYNLDIKEVGELKPEDLERLIENIENSLWESQIFENAKGVTQNIEKGLFNDTWLLTQQFKGVEK